MCVTRIRNSLFFVLALVYGCSSDVDVVKEGRLQGLPEYTVSQALDNRAICESASWSNFEDDKGRNIVRYKCEMKDVEGLYYEMAQDLINKGERKESQKQLEVRIAETKENISNKEKEIEINIKEIKQEIPEKEREIQEEISRRNNESGTLTVHKDLLARGSELRRRRSGLEIEIYNLHRSIERMKEELPEMERRLEEEKASAAEDLELGHYIMENHEDTAAYEIIDWLVIEEEKFIVLGGSLFHKGVGENEFRETRHSDVELVIAMIYEGDIENYFDYRDALGY